LDDVGYVTSDTLWGEFAKLKEVPQRLVVLGGGPIGCELAQSFARLGSHVTQVEMGARIMVREDAEVSELAQASLETDGVQVLTGHKALRCELRPVPVTASASTVNENRSTVTASAAKQSMDRHASLAMTSEDVAMTSEGVAMTNEGMAMTSEGVPTTFEKCLIVEHNASFDAQEKILYGLLDLPFIRRCCIDATGLGMQLAERAVKRYGARVEAVGFTPKVKEELAYPLRAAFVDKGIRVPQDKLIETDLRSVKKESTAAGNVRFVADRGPGISPETAAHLFEPFTSKADGLGLGLNICRTIVEGHGGHLGYANRDDGGAVFYFTLPPAP
jgi:phage FluMu gp28-like protein